MPAFDDIPDDFQETNFGGAFDGSVWAQVYNYAIDYALNEYYFESTTKGVGSTHWNTMVALKRIIEKCDSLQSQIDELSVEPYELTATKICEAWAKDEFKDRALTIAFIDRMRQLIWDEPFFVAWAAKPES